MSLLLLSREGLLLLRGRSLLLLSGEEPAAASRKEQMAAWLEHTFSMLHAQVPRSNVKTGHAMQSQQAVCMHHAAA